MQGEKLSIFLLEIPRSSKTASYCLSRKKTVNYTPFTRGRSRFFIPPCPPFLAELFHRTAKYTPTSSLPIVPSILFCIVRDERVSGVKSISRSVLLLPLARSRRSFIPFVVLRSTFPGRVRSLSRRFYLTVVVDSRAHTSLVRGARKSFVSFRRTTLTPISSHVPFSPRDSFQHRSI